MRWRNNTLILASAVVDVLLSQHTLGLFGRRPLILAGQLLDVHHAFRSPTAVATRHHRHRHPKSHSHCSDRIAEPLLIVSWLKTRTRLTITDQNLSPKRAMLTFGLIFEWMGVFGQVRARYWQVWA